MPFQSFLSALSFRARLTLMVIALVFAAVGVITGSVYMQYRNSYVTESLRQLQQRGEADAAAFNQWLLARQDEMRFLARLDASRQMNRTEMDHLLQELLAVQPAYDTIFVVDEQGRGVAGVANDGQVRLLSRQQAYDFHVADRDWFQRAIQGKEVFSPPLISRATGQRISNVVIPIYNDDRIVGVMRGAVSMDTIIRRVAELSDDEDMEAFLLDRERRPVTPVRSLTTTDAVLDTHAAHELANGKNGSDRYLNAAAQTVLGSYTSIPLLGWGLVQETPEATALAEVNAALWQAIGLALLTMAIALAAVLAMVRSILRTLGGEPAYAANVVHRMAEGDMTLALELNANDTTSLLASIQAMQDNLRKIIARLHDNADSVATAATQLQQINGETDKGVRRQVAQIHDAATAIDELTATVEEVSRNTQAAADSVQEVSAAVANGRHLAAETKGMIGQLAGEVVSARDVIDNLKQGADAIDNVMRVIREVAEQTNLLALNAAIEAARAGESGRGFAVVADEVRELARRTQQSTAEIEETIKALQAQADQASKVMDSGSDSAQESVAHVEHLDQSFADMEAAVLQIEEMAIQIAGATEQQSAATMEINRGIHAIREVSDQSARGVIETSAASSSLAELAEQLRQLMQHFRT